MSHLKAKLLCCSLFNTISSNLGSWCGKLCGKPRLSQASLIVQVAAGRNLEILYPQQMCGVERGRTFRPSVVVTSGPSGTRGPPPQSGISKFFLNPSHSSGLCDTRLSSTEVWLLPTLESPQSCGGERSTLGAAASQEDRLPHPTGQHTERARL